MSQNPVTTHVLNTASGTPAVGIRIKLEKMESVDGVDREHESWTFMGSTITNSDGRGPGLISPSNLVRNIRMLLNSLFANIWTILISLLIWPQSKFTVGIYRTTFFTQEYFDALGVSTFYPRVEVYFRITEPSQHYHIPLLISPFGYSTYRGS